jgi:hypothetical protein
MIAAGFLPACAAAWHRGALALVTGGWWRDLPGADALPPAMWLALPAGVLTLLIVGTAASSRRRALLLLGVSAFVQPWLLPALLPLALGLGSWPSGAAFRARYVTAVGVWLAGLLLTPSCAPFAARAPTAAALAAAWWASVGVAGGLLLFIDALFGANDRRAQLAAGVAILVAGTLVVTGAAGDASALIGLGAAILWWRAAAGARLVMAWQMTAGERLGAGLLMALVPVLALMRANDAVVAPGPPAVEVWQALEEAGSRPVIVAAGDRADTAAVIWRSGPAPRQALNIVAADPPSVAPHLAASTVYTWDRVARTMAMRGMLVAPAARANAAQTRLWRVLQFEGCQALTAEWAEAGRTVTDGQFSGVFPIADPLRGALLYIGSEHALEPEPLDWPPESLQGFQSWPFDRERPADSEKLTEFLTRDGLDADVLRASRHVTRLKFDRRGTAPETLGIRLGGIATTAWARHYVSHTADRLRQPQVCRNSAGLGITAYAGAPPSLALDLAGRHTVGGGWHAPERNGDDTFRWTAAREANLLFAAHAPQSLVLRLDAAPATGDWASANVHVALNGVDAPCRAGAPPCEWLLPGEAMRAGLNVIALHSETVPAPAPDPRRLGLLVRAAELVKP